MCSSGRTVGTERAEWPGWTTKGYPGVAEPGDGMAGLPGGGGVLRFRVAGPEAALLSWRHRPQNLLPQEP